jgi:hypothetical protein
MTADSSCNYLMWLMRKSQYEFSFAAVCVEGSPCLMLNTDSTLITHSPAKQDESRDQDVHSPGKLSFILIDLETLITDQVS